VFVRDLLDRAGLDEKSDSFSYRMKIVGSLTFGETSAPIVYTANPRFRAFKFAADAGDKVTVDVTSTNGDAVAWILNDEFEVVASNDDADETTFDAHIDVTLPALPTYEDGTGRRTHYIVFRDFWLRRRTFTVALAGTSGFKSCQKDADCIKVQAGCCGLSFTAIHKDGQAAYDASLGCDANPICPAMVLRLTDDVAQCDSNINECVLVDPHAIRCGGHVINMHSCPEGYDCVGEGLAYDVPGVCRASCGGFTAKPCAEGFTCVDNFMDDCDPATGGADCIGICSPATCLGFGNLECPAGLDCIEDPTDSCDVNNGGADCGGLCTIH